jgi:hypothetical protein
LELPDQTAQPQSLVTETEKNGFLVIDVVDANGNSQQAGNNVGEVKDVLSTAEQRAAILRTVMLRQRAQLKKCLESVRLVERNAGNKILRLDSSKVRKRNVGTTSCTSTG